MDANGLSSFDLFREDSDFGLVQTREELTSVTMSAGLNGHLGPRWTWDAYVTYGQTTDHSAQRDQLPQNLAYASDAVRDPATGQIVCRAALAGNPSAANCIPMNVFGQGSPSAASIGYVMGQSLTDVIVTQQAEAVTLHGTLFQGWAGPVSVALGAEHRADPVKVRPDSHQQNGEFLITNNQTLDGSVSVTEGFLETGVPLLSNIPFAKSLDLNAAVRETHYSTAGSVTTWKDGFTYAPVEAIKLRATRSRDIRAPNVNELFAAPTVTGFFTLTDPFTNTTPLVRQFTAGNAGLKPEVADTTTVGIVLQPDFGPGLRASVDWYDIKLKGQVAVLDPQDLLNRCFSGDTSLCGFFNRDATGVLSTVDVTSLNVAKSRRRGVDFEVDYRQSLQELFTKGAGALTFRVFGNYMPTMEVNLNGVTTTNYAGSLLSLPDTPALPKWRWDGSVTYDLGPFAATTSVRYIGSGQYATYLPSQLSAAQNSVGSRHYGLTAGSQA